MKLQPEIVKAGIWGLIIMASLAIAIAVGSRNLAYFDAALVAYTFATLFAAFGITYRYTMWLQRPPTALYWRRGWQVFFNPKRMLANVRNLFTRVTVDFAGNRFIWKRGKLRWLAHFLIMWGCIVAFGITFPLVFGWLHFTTVEGNLELYQAYLFGFPMFQFDVYSFAAFFLFHGLVWSSIMVIIGVMLAMWRRMHDHGAAALQQFVEDILPLILLFAISVTGVMLTASYTWMRGYAFDFIAILHAITVIFTLLYMPFGKFFHIFQRPAQLGAGFYKDAGAAGKQAECRRCGTEYSSELHIKDLIAVERKLGYRYEVDGEVEHYQWICPPCRRAMFVLAQTRLWQGQYGDVMISGEMQPQTSRFGNPVIGDGPLGVEDKTNTHF